MTKLSVNINKIATIRNARGGNTPNVAKASVDCERFGAEGITVHPRPDERHIRYSDVREIRPLITTEFNIEGNPIPSFIQLVTETTPHQVTLVPDAEDAITSNAGWDTIRHRDFLTEVCAELYTEPYADLFPIAPDTAIAPFIRGAETARNCGLGLNAGHDLNLNNLEFFIRNIPWTDEVSIGHAIISDALYMGLEATIKAYLSKIKIF